MATRPKFAEFVRMCRMYRVSNVSSPGKRVGECLANVSSPGKVVGEFGEFSEFLS